MVLVLRVLLFILFRIRHEPFMSGHGHHCDDYIKRLDEDLTVLESQPDEDSDPH
jgi:hypothetical protein